MSYQHAANQRDQIAANDTSTQKNTPLNQTRSDYYDDKQGVNYAAQTKKGVVSTGIDHAPGHGTLQQQPHIEVEDQRATESLSHSETDTLAERIVY